MNQKRNDLKAMTRLALLVAIELVMKAIGLGSVPVGPLYMSFLTLPIAVGAITMGPAAGLILGGVFGAVSFYDAVTGGSAMTSALFQVSPLHTFILCVGTRQKGQLELPGQRHVRPRPEHPVLYGIHRPVLLQLRLCPGSGGRQRRGQSPRLCGAAGRRAGRGRISGQRPAGRFRRPGRRAVSEINTNAFRQALWSLPFLFVLHTSPVPGIVWGRGRDA